MPELSLELSCAELYLTKKNLIGNYQELHALPLLALKNRNADAIGTRISDPGVPFVNTHAEGNRRHNDWGFATPRRANARVVEASLRYTAWEMQRVRRIVRPAGCGTLMYGIRGRPVMAEAKAGNDPAPEHPPFVGGGGIRVEAAPGVVVLS